MNKHGKSLLPKRFLWRLTFLNIFVVASFIVISSLAIYHTACYLVDGMGTMNNQKQEQFNSTLFLYLLIFSVSAIVIGSLIHFYLTRKMIRPIRRLIDSTKTMKKGQYPSPIEVKTEDEVGQLIANFNELVQQLKNNHQNRNKLVSNLSHEFRTPLSNLNGYLNALTNEVIEGDPKLYQSLHEETERIINMVEQLEQLKEWDYVSKQNFYEKELVDMQVLVEQAVEMFRWSLKKAGISVNVQIESGKVNVYNGGVSQVVTNLLDNAIRYYHGSGPIMLKGENLKSEYRFTVTGPGQAIPIAEQEKIFERFYRIDPSRNRETGGSGLGLAISKELIEHHNGRIGFSSEGDNHIFWFTLPLSK